jgi:hypothetical protein
MQHKHVYQVSRISSILTWHVDLTCFWYSMWYFEIFGSLNLQDQEYLVYFSFATKGKYLIIFLSK